MRWRSPRNEFDANRANAARRLGNVHFFEDTADRKNQMRFSQQLDVTHHDGRIALSRCIQPAGEASAGRDIVEDYVSIIRVTEVIDYSPFENEGCCWKAQAVLCSTSPEQNCVRYRSKSLESENDPNASPMI